MDQTTSPAHPPRILVLGALTSVGRHIVAHLTRTAAPLSVIRAVDRRTLSLVHLLPADREAFTRIEYMQLNLRSAEGIANAFDLPDGGKFDCVLNCSAYAFSWEVEEIHRQRFITGPVRIAEEVVARGIPVYVLLSSGRFYRYEGRRMTEEGAFHENTPIARYTHMMEEAVRAVPNLPLVILRPAVPYGEEKANPIITLWIAADLHTRTRQKWEANVGKDLHFNLVAIPDIARAMVHVARWYVETGKTGCTIYNLASDMDYKIGDNARDLFKLFPDLIGATRNVEALGALTVEERAADGRTRYLLMHEYWVWLLMDNGLQASPIFPSLDVEYLVFDHIAVDGRAITRDTGFTYEYDGGLSHELMLRTINAYMDEGWWPRRVLGEPFPHTTPVDEDAPSPFIPAGESLYAPDTQENVSSSDKDSP